MTVTVIGKPGCVRCTATERALDTAKIEFEKVDATQQPEYMDKVLELGYKEFPVVLAGDEHWSGFRLDKINGLTVA